MAQRHRDRISNDDESALEIKMVLLGDMGVGKTSIAQQFVTNTFNPNSEPTIRISFQTKVVVIDDETVNVRIWDTAGQEKYRSLAPIYYRGADCAVLVYDSSRRETFNVLKYWVKELSVVCKEKIEISMAANKYDIEQKEVDVDEGKAYAGEIGSLFSETSARDGTNVNDLFMSTVRAGVANKKRKQALDRDGDRREKYLSSDLTEIDESGPTCPCSLL
eukprot:TRINITY_DN15090_c0_g1_i1.p1 TRINITY_DN15090_c0_g1~~TRINITY_DN15090_c0_g1_i1.p1  ORF type:complete len:219 (-),score=64.32 TRINITY_DN15090_c0_g1_i1:27-683(-)